LRDVTGLQVTALAGGVGAARFLRGVVAHLADEHPGSHLTIIGNTADDLRLYGLHVSPDLDTVLYTLGGGVHDDQGWGRADETFTVQSELANYGVEPQWFTLGDRDMATHILRTQMLGGYSLSQVTEALSRRWLASLPIPTRLVPMTDDRVETHVVVREPLGPPHAIHFQEWWVRHQAQLPVEKIVLVGIEQAEPAPGVLDAIAGADVVLLPPSNPVVSIGPILSVPGVRDAVRSAAPVVGVSPIIGGRPVRGMADACLAAIGVDTTAAAVAGMYVDVLDGWLVDDVDADAVDEVAGLGMAARATPLLMRDAASTRAIARGALDLALSSRP
jgi:LPPG:FO 2-phospho-L-lactate transferase